MVTTKTGIATDKVWIAELSGNIQHSWNVTITQSDFLAKKYAIV